MDQPKQFQLEGIDFLVPRDVAILGDEAGLGKSMQLIRAAERRGLLRILILCPAIGRISWGIQMRTWQSNRRPVYVFPDQTGGLIPQGPIALIVTLDWLQDRKQAVKFINALRRTAPFDVAFVDEAHYLKNGDANRTKAVYGEDLDLVNAILERIKVAWLATATLTPNNVSEIYPHMRGLFPSLLSGLFSGMTPTQQQFNEKFTNQRRTPFGWKIDGNNKNTIPELRDALRPHFLARRKADVLADLDPALALPLPLEIRDPGDPHGVEAKLAALLSGEDMDPGELLSGVDGEHIASRRMALGELKAHAAIEWIENLLADPDKKLVIFAHHRSVLDILARKLSRFGLVRVDGGTTPKQDEKSVYDFQNAAGIRLFCGQTLKANTSITLTAAQDALLLEPDWTPVNNYQAISRCHRIGQKGSVTGWFAYANRTMDELIVKALRRKASDFFDLFGVDVSTGTI